MVRLTVMGQVRMVMPPGVALHWLVLVLARRWCSKLTAAQLISSM